MNDYKTFPPETRLSTIFLTALYPSPPPLSPPCPSLSLHQAFKWVVGFGEEPGTSQGVGGGGADPETATMTSYQSWMPERGEAKGREG